jgi:hypothetical protein
MMVLAATPTLWNVLSLCKNFQKPFTCMCILLDQCLDNNLIDMHWHMQQCEINFYWSFLQ